MSEHLIKPTRISICDRRRRVMIALLALAALGLLGRAVDLHLNHKEFLQGQGTARYQREVPIPAHRGKLLDRNGEPLAISTPVDSIWAHPDELLAARARWPELAGVLGLDLARLEHRLVNRRGREFLYLRRHVTPTLAGEVDALRVPGVYRRREYRRYYPLGEVAAHVVGITNVDDRGQEGLELAFDDELTGRAGARRVIKSRLGEVVEYVDRVSAPQPGRDLTLSIDGRIQYLAYRSLLTAIKRHKARAASATVLDVRTGEVLAMVNLPSFNPNNRSDRTGARLRNRAVTDVFEPGSTLKPFTVAAALEAGSVSASTVIDARPGVLKIAGHKVSDVRNFGRIDVATVLKKSSNIGAVRIALGIEPKSLWQTLSRVGFGSSTSSGLPGESEGVLRHYLDWRPIDQVTLSYGYGAAVTGLQLAQAYAVVANGGLLPRLTVLRDDRPRIWVRVMSGDTAARVRSMLEGVMAPDGTGHRGRVAGFRVAGKTGTVRKSRGGGYADDIYQAVFAGIAPVSDPRIAVVVMVDEPGGERYYGGQVSAPVFASIVAGALRVVGVAPDDLDVVSRRMSLAATAAEPTEVVR